MGFEPPGHGPPLGLGELDLGNDLDRNRYPPRRVRAAAGQPGSGCRRGALPGRGSPPRPSDLPRQRRPEDLGDIAIVCAGETGIEAVRGRGAAGRSGRRIRRSVPPRPANRGLCRWPPARPWQASATTRSGPMPRRVSRRTCSPEPIVVRVPNRASVPSGSRAQGIVRRGPTPSSRMPSRGRQGARRNAVAS